MRKILTILLFLISATVFAQTNYYIDEGGTDGPTHTGAIGDPWLTLGYAVTRVTTPGDTIHINAGTYSISSIVYVPVGVSLVGDGETSILSCTYAAHYAIYLLSSTQGTEGNQTIRQIKFDGNDTGYGALFIRYRSNVLVHDCWFLDFTSGVNFKGNSSTSEPTTYSTGNKFYDNEMLDCAGWTGGTRTTGGTGRGCLEFSGQDGMLIYGNTIQNIGKDDDDAGYCIKEPDGYVKNTKIYNNTIQREQYKGLTWDFAIELYGRTVGGNEIYDNTIYGSVDVNDSYKGDEAYSVWIYDNTIGQAARSTYGTSPDGIYQATSGVIIEKHTENVIVEKNHIKNVVRGVYVRLGGAYTADEVRISYNIFEDINTTTSAPAGTVASCLWWVINSGEIASNFDIWNNTCYATLGNSNATRGLLLPHNGTVSNFSIRNNIITNFYNAPIYGSKTGTAIDVLSIENNIFYNNGNSNTVYLTGTAPDPYTNQNNLTSDPLLIGGSPFNFDIGSESPAINAGLDVGLTTDYVDSTIVGLPDVGAYEYYDDDPPVDPTVVTTVQPYWASNTTATSGGNVISDGGGTVSQKGVCWNTVGTPTTADDKSEEGAGTGVYSSTMTGLSRSETYYVRAYATNETGTSYGEEMTFRASQMLIHESKALRYGGKLLIID